MKKSQLKKWQDLPIGAIITTPGNSKEYETGNWIPETEVVWDKQSCIDCRLCWGVCPDSAIKLDQEGKMAGVDPDACKKCGLCIGVCPSNPKSLKFQAKEATKI